MNSKCNILVYDGSFDGLLTCIFTSYEQKLEVTEIAIEGKIQQDFFSSPEFIVTDEKKADRVKAGLLSKISAAGLRQLLFAFLSEIPGIELCILQYAKQAFNFENFSPKDYGDPTILRIAQTAKMVNREKHRMEAFVRFKLTKDQIFFSQIEPDFNVLPLILKHFESRYADQKWVIYDNRRKFGIYYDLENTVYMNFENYQNDKDRSPKESIYDATETDFENLWQNYFNSVNIASRKNTRLHVQHVPKRYWKYLSEKSPLHI